MPGLAINWDFIPDRLARIVSIAKRAVSNAWIINGHEKADAKSIIDLLMLACKYGTNIKILIDGLKDLPVLHAITGVVETESQHP